jgi:hypothetical protein
MAAVKNTSLISFLLSFFFPVIVTKYSVEVVITENLSLCYLKRNAFSEVYY